MRIIGGSYKGLKIIPPTDLPVRPTTDVAKESLFNILQNRLEIDGLQVLDLFSGTGNISLEFASRGAKVVSVDVHPKCVKFLKQKTQELQIEIETLQSDVFSFLQKNANLNAYDLIFADPPFDLNRVPELHRLIFDNHWLATYGCLIIENPSNKIFSNLSNFEEQRTYGSVAFNFFTL